MMTPARTLPRSAQAVITARAILVGIVVLFSVIAWQAFHKPPSEFLPHPHLYGALAIVAAVTAGATLIVPRVVWHSTAGACVVLACWIRAAALAWAAYDAPLPDDRQTGRWIGAALWTVTGQLVMAAWVVIVIPWAVRSRTRQG